MSAAVDLVLLRLIEEEGERSYAYDDATGKEVTGEGNITWGRGYNLKAIASPALFDVIDRFLLDQCDTALRPYRWYRALDAVRASACLDIAYNAGVAGLLRYTRMIAALTQNDWLTAAKECTTSNPVLIRRYNKLSKMILMGEA